MVLILRSENFQNLPILFFCPSFDSIIVQKTIMTMSEAKINVNGTLIFGAADSHNKSKKVEEIKSISDLNKC